MRLDETARGVFPIAPTPFASDGAIDWTSVDRMVDFYAEVGATGLTVLGVMGEAPKLDASESAALAARFIRRAGALPVVVGVSAPGFAAMRALALSSMAAGAAGVMIAPPSTLRTDDAIVTYYRQAIEAIGADVPVVVQDYPLTFTVVMAPGVIRRIVDENPSCVMLKHEDWPGLDKIATLRRWSDEGAMRRIAILCGNGGLFLDFEGERGADGAMTGYAFPDMLVDVVRMGGGGAARCRPRPLRRPPAAAALRAAARDRARGAQIRHGPARHHRGRYPAQAGRHARCGRAVRGRIPARPPGPPGPARRAATRADLKRSTGPAARTGRTFPGLKPAGRRARRGCRAARPGP